MREAGSDLVVVRILDGTRLENSCEGTVAADPRETAARIMGRRLMSMVNAGSR